MRIAALMAAGALIAVPVLSSPALASPSAPASASSAPSSKTRARISLAQARKIALKAYPGKIIAEELEHEKGGSGLRYSFDIRHGKIVHEVGVDAVTGKVLENDVDNGGD